MTLAEVNEILRIINTCVAECPLDRLDVSMSRVPLLLPSDGKNVETFAPVEELTFVIKVTGEFHV